MGIQINNKQVLDMNYLGKKAYSAVLNGDYVFASTLKKVSGVLQNIKDAAALSINKLYLEGNSHQETTSGSNMLNFNVTQRVDYVTYNEDGTITINGNGGFNLKFEEITLSAGQTYYQKVELVSGSISGITTNGCGIMDVAKNNFINLDTFVKIAPTNDTNCSTLWCHVNAVFNNATFKIWLNADKSDFEKYTNGASPNPDYPQEVEVIEGSVDVEVTGSNLLNIANGTITSNGVTVTKENGKITLNGTATANCFIKLAELGIFKAGTYTISANNPQILSVTSTVLRIMRDNTNVLSIATTNFSKTNNKATFTTTEDYVGANGVLPFFQLRVNSGTVFDNFVLYPQMEKGSTATKYEPYKSTIATLDLQGNFLAKLGDVKDELDVVSGKLTKRIGKVVLNGSENWLSASSVVEGTSRFYYENSNVYNEILSTSTKIYVISDKFVSTYWRGIYDGDKINKNLIANYNDTNNRTGRIVVRIDNNYASSVATFKTWLASNNVEVYYVLAEPYEVQLDITRIPLFEGINNIKIGTNLEPTLVETEYYMC